MLQGQELIDSLIAKVRNDQMKAASTPEAIKAQARKKAAVFANWVEKYDRELDIRKALELDYNSKEDIKTYRRYLNDYSEKGINEIIKLIDRKLEIERKLGEENHPSYSPVRHKNWTIYREVEQSYLEAQQLAA